MFLVELIASSFLDLISKQARPVNAAVGVFLLIVKCTPCHDLVDSSNLIDSLSRTTID